MKLLTCRAVVVAVLSVCPWSAVSRSFAPSQAPTPSHIAALRFNGLNLFTSEQVSSAIGLRVGDPVSPSRLATAADFLAKSGAFDDVNYRYSADDGAVTVEFRLVETKKVLPCFFDNFVWFSDRMGQVHFSGIPERAVKDLADGWKIKPGEIYDGHYPLEFMREFALSKLLKNGVTVKESSTSLQRDKQKAIVDLYFVFH